MENETESKSGYEWLINDKPAPCVVGLEYNILNLRAAKDYNFGFQNQTKEELEALEKPIEGLNEHPNRRIYGTLVVDPFKENPLFQDIEPVSMTEVEPFDLRVRISDGRGHGAEITFLDMKIIKEVGCLENFVAIGDKMSDVYVVRYHFRARGHDALGPTQNGEKLPPSGRKDQLFTVTE